MAVAKFMQRKLVGKCIQQKGDMERFNLMMLNDAEIKEIYGDYTSNNRGPALKNVYHGEDMKRVWKSITENIQISCTGTFSYYKWKQHKP